MSGVNVEAVIGNSTTGDVGAVLNRHNWDPGALRPWLGADGRSYITIMKRDRITNAVVTHNEQSIQAYAAATKLKFNSEMLDNMMGKPIYVNRMLQNDTATLRKDEWIEIDRALIQQARPNMMAWNDLRAVGTYNISGMGKTQLEYEVNGDIGPARVTMDGVSRGDTDQSEYELRGLPLPIVSKDLEFALRLMNASRANGSTPIDTVNVGLAGIKCAETVEQMVLGVGPTATMKWLGKSIYGYKNFPNRLTRVLTNPTSGGWTGATLINELLLMKTQSMNARHRGPWKIYCSTAWDPYLDADYSASKGDNTLRERIGRITGFSQPQSSDWLTGYTMILVQQTPNVARAVVSVEMTTVQWPSQGGFLQNFKVLCIYVPQLRDDIIHQTGIVDGTAP
jgi:hypothetical protein